MTTSPVRLTLTAAAALLLAAGGARAEQAFRLVEVTATHLPDSPLRNSMDVGVADLDGDGDLDLVRGEHGPLTVWLNDGRGVFTDVSDTVLADRAEGPNIALALADFDGDGRLDVYVGQLKASRPDEGIRDRLLLNRPG